MSISLQKLLFYHKKRYNKNTRKDVVGMPNYSRNNLTGQAYDIILKKIIDAEYEPGQKISEKKIEEDLQIGRTPVREALLQLRQEQLINVIPQSGTYIAKIDLKDVLDARFVRASVERRIMREAATLKLNEEQIAYLDRIIENEKRTRESDDFPAFLDSDDVFHEYFYKLTDHQRVWDWLKKINIQFNRFRFLRLKVQKLSWQGLIEEHIAIYKAIKTNDVNEADRLTANHMHRMLDEEESLIKSFPDYFDNID